MAQKWGGVLVNCDSIQCYQGLKIGSALPTEEEQALVPHFLYAYVPEGVISTAGQYSRDFFYLLRKFKQPTLFWVVGGTGFYFQALEKGMYPVRHVKPEIKERVAQEMEAPGGLASLYAELLNRDPEAARKIASQDAYRIGRAIELIRGEGKTVSEIQKNFSEMATPFPYPLLKVGIQRSREELVQKISLRTNKMIQDGLVEEVQGLLRKGLRNWAPLSSVGYKETVQMLESKGSQSWLLEEINRNTIRLTKKQRTWFRRDPQIHWIDLGESLESLENTVGLHEFLQTWEKR